MKQLISGIQEVSKAFGRLPKRTVRSSGEKSISRGEEYANAFSSVLAPCRIIATRALFSTPKSQGKYSIASQTSTDYCKRTIGDKTLYDKIALYSLIIVVVYIIFVATKQFLT